MKILTFFLTIKISYFLFSRYVKFRDLPLHKRDIYSTLTSFSFFPFRFFKCLNWYMCGHNLPMKFPPNFHNYTQDWIGLWIPSLNLSWLHQINYFWLEITLICKMGKSNIVWGAFPKKSVFCKKSFPKDFAKFTENCLCYNLFLILLKVFRPSGFQLF